MAVVHPYEFGARFVEALGLAGRPVQKVVLVVEEDCVVTAYVKLLVQTDEADRITEATRMIFVEDVQVADDCIVTVTPRVPGGD